jgi:hypothetical protein
VIPYYYALSYLCGAWFHPDWDLDDPDWRDVVRRFARVMSAVEVADTAHELRDLLGHGLPEPELRDLMIWRYDLAQSPWPEEMTMTGWLTAMLEELERGAPGPGADAPPTP